MNKFVPLLLLGTCLTSAAAAEPLVLASRTGNLSLSIYNQNLSLVKDSRPADLKSGVNEVIFDGVAQRIQPETAIIYADEVKVIEQNYNYNLLSYSNFIERNIDKDVMTVRTNPETGENIYERATLIGTAGGKPILRFSYGIDTDFAGRVVFNEIPAGMSNKPTLTAKLNAKSAGNKNLYLAYLTDGLSWKTDYVAKVNSPTALNLTGWVTITNESGIDYNNAKIQLIAGEVNVVRSHAPRMMKAMALNSASFGMEDAASITPESLNSYELYTLPTTTTIKDHQTKQIALIEKAGVTYKKEFNLNTPFYFGNNGSEFEKHHPTITYVMENTATANLGISLPAGTVRFYENDKNGNLQFIGSNRISHTAKEDTLRLNLGEAFNISVTGKAKKVKEKELSSTQPDSSRCRNIHKLLTYEVEATVNNAEDVDNTVILSQHFGMSYKIVKESVKSTEKNANTRQWPVNVSKNSKQTLTYTVEVQDNDRVCQ